MSRRREAAFSLIEVLVCVAVVAVAVGGLAIAMTSFGRFSTHQAGPVRGAAMLLAEQTLRVAQDAWKYGSPGTAPSGTWQTSVPLNLPGGGAISAPVTVTASVSNVNAESAQMNVSVRYTPDAAHPDDPGIISMTGQTQVKAPIPGARVLNPSLIPAPSGAP